MEVVKKMERVVEFIFLIYRKILGIEINEQDVMCGEFYNL